MTETKAVAVAVAATAAGTTVSLDVLGIPVLVVLAAFLGAAGILSFMSRMPLPRMVGTVLFCAPAGILASGMVARSAWLAGEPLAQPLAALAVAALLQIVTPWAVENKGEIVSRLLGLFTRAPQPPKGGDK